MQNSNHIWKEVVPLPGPQYERCSFIPIDGKGDSPDFLFRINTEHGEGGPLLLSVELFLYPDSGLWEFANNHPQWRKDVRPLLLMLVQDILWKFKILDCGEEPSTVSGRNADPKHEGGLDFALVAKRFCKGDDATLISLANYANTHVIDQLQAVYTQNPSLRWTEERAAEIKAKFYQDFAVKQQRSDSQRKERLSGWKRSAERQIYFIDESGDLGFSDLNTHFLYHRMRDRIFGCYVNGSGATRNSRLGMGKHKTGRTSLQQDS